MFRRSLLLTGAAIVLTLGAACTSDDSAPTETATPAPTSSPIEGTGEQPAGSADPVTDDFLRNAVITTDLVSAGEVHLEGGEYSEVAAPGSASMIEFVIDSTVIDDLDGDGTDDGAMIVRSSGGGSGTFYTLHVYLASEDGPLLVASEQLGDRIEVQGIQSMPGEITVEYLDRDESAPMSTAPNVPATRTVAVASDGSVTVPGSGANPAVDGPTTGGGTSGSAGAAGSTGSVDPAPADACASLAPEAYDAAFTFVSNVVSGAYLENGATVSGCSRTFESNVPWRLEDREGNVIAESFTMGGGVDGPAPFEFVVECSVASSQVGHLFVGGDDPSGGAGFPPVNNQIPVVLLP